MSNRTNDDAATLESLIDTYGLSNIVDAVAQVCYAKAEHLESNWQDKVTARAWREDAAKLLKLSVRLPERAGSYPRLEVQS